MKKRYDKGIPKFSKRLAVVIVFVFSFQGLAKARSYGDTTRMRPNIINFELLGNTIIWSVNYERILWQKPGFAFGARIGYNRMAAGTIGEGQNKTKMVPIELLMILGERHHLEVGIGATNVFEYIEGADERTEYQLFPTLKMGYRYQAEGGRFFFRASCTFFLNSETNNPLLPGTAVGFAF